MSKFPGLQSRRRATALLLSCLIGCTPIAFAQEGGEPQTRRPQIVEAAANDSRIETIVSMINGQIDNKINIYGKAAGQRVTIFADGVPVEDALSQIANPNNLVWWRDDNGDYGIGDREYYERVELSKKVIQKVFRPNNVKASELDRAIKGLITPNLGSSVADDRTNKLIINDLPGALERIERFIREIDVQLIVRVFYVRHADVEDLASKIENYKSDPGTIEVDQKTHQIIVTDLLSNIKKMELLIDILDVGPEIIIYDVNNVGIEGEDLEDLQAIIDTIRTQDLLFEVNNKQGVFILEDVPEVHERVEQILAEFDRPVRQVLIQGEILSTDYNRTLSFGVNSFQFAQDLPLALAESAVPGAVGFAGGSFTDFRRVFPNLGYSAGTTTGRFLSSSASAELSMAYSDSRTRVLLQPRLLVKNQETSKIFVGADVPFTTTFRDTGNNGSDFTTTTQSTVQDGLSFEATPSISNSYLIELELSIDNDNAEPVPGAETTLIRKDRQNVDTVLQIPSGRTRMIGGLIEDSRSRNSAGLPFISSIPIIGALFGNQNTTDGLRNLVVFITPSVVEEDEVRSNADGRRGRRVTNNNEGIGEFDLQLGSSDVDGEMESFLDSINMDDLLSGDSEEEKEMLEQIRQLQEKRRVDLGEDSGSNYVPSQNFGQTTLNTSGGVSTSTQGNRPQVSPQPNPGNNGGGQAPPRVTNETTY